MTALGQKSGIYLSITSTAVGQNGVEEWKRWGEVALVKIPPGTLEEKEADSQVYTDLPQATWDKPFKPYGDTTNSLKISCTGVNPTPLPPLLALRREPGDTHGDKEPASTSVVNHSGQSNGTRGIMLLTTDWHCSDVPSKDAVGCDFLWMLACSRGVAQNSSSSATLPSDILWPPRIRLSPSSCVQ